MKEHKKRARETSSFFKDILTLATGAAGAQIIAILFTPIITRIYGPEAFGIQSTFMSLGASLAILATFSLPQAIPLPFEQNKSKEIFDATITVSITASAITAIFISIFDDRISYALGMQNSFNAIHFLPAFMLLSSIHATLTNIMIREKKYKQIAKTTISGTLISNTSKVACWQFAPYATTLIAINTATLVIQSIMLAKNTPIIFKTLPKRIKLSTIKSYKNFIIFTTPQAAINTLSLGLPVILLSTYTGTNNAGYFALTATVLAIPANLIGTSTAQAFYKKAIDSKHKGKVISNEVKSLTRTMLLAALLPFLIIMIQAPNIFSIIFGESWREAGVYAQILAPYYFLSLLNKPAVAVLPIIGAQSGLLAYEIIATTLRASTLIAALHFQVGEKTALALYSAIGSAAYIALILWSFRATKNAEAT